MSKRKIEVLEEEEIDVVILPAPKYNKEVKVQSLFPAHLNYRGRISGKLYEWQSAGDILLVLDEDVEELLSKRISRNSCCGTGQVDGNRLFQIID